MQAGDILLRDLDDGGILRLTLNDPARRNALTWNTPHAVRSRGRRTRV
jgi:hypothetical protein